RPVEVVGAADIQLDEVTGADGVIALPGVRVRGAPSGADNPEGGGSTKLTHTGVELVGELALGDPLADAGEEMPNPLLGDLGGPRQAPDLLLSFDHPDLAEERRRRAKVGAGQRRGEGLPALGKEVALVQADDRIGQ